MAALRYSGLVGNRAAYMYIYTFHFFCTCGSFAGGRLFKSLTVFQSLLYAHTVKTAMGTR